MAEEGEVPLKVEETEEGEKQQNQEDTERTRESSPSSASSSDQEEVDAGKEKEEEDREQPKQEPPSEGSEQQAESQEPAESMQIFVVLMSCLFLVAVRYIPRLTCTIETRVRLGERKYEGGGGDLGKDALFDIFFF